MVRIPFFPGFICLGGLVHLFFATERYGVSGELRDGSSFASCSIAKGVEAAGSCGRLKVARCKVRADNILCRDKLPNSVALRGKSVSFVQIRLRLASHRHRAHCLNWAFRFSVRNIYKPLAVTIDVDNSKTRQGNSSPNWSDFGLNLEDFRPPGKLSRKRERRTVVNRRKHILVQPDDGVELPEVVSRRPLLDSSNKININLCVVHKSFAEEESRTNVSRHEDDSGLQFRSGGRSHASSVHVEILPDPFSDAALTCRECSERLALSPYAQLYNVQNSEAVAQSPIAEQAIWSEKTGVSQHLPLVVESEGANSSIINQGLEPDENLTERPTSMGPSEQSAPQTVGNTGLASGGHQTLYASQRVAADDLSLMWTGARLFVTLSLVVLLLTFSVAFFYLLCRERRPDPLAGPGQVVSRLKPWNSLKFLREKEVSSQESLTDGISVQNADGRITKKVDIVATAQDALCQAEAEAEATRLKAKLGLIKAKQDVHYQVTPLQTVRTTNYYDDVDVISPLPEEKKCDDKLGEYAQLRADAPVTASPRSRKGSYEHVYDLPPTKGGQLLPMAGKDYLLAGGKYAIPDRSETSSSSGSAAPESVQPSPYKSGTSSLQCTPVEDKGIYKSLILIEDSSQNEDSTDRKTGQSEAQKVTGGYVSPYRIPTKNS